MTAAALEATIDAAWEARDEINPQTKGETRDAVESALGMLDSGEARVAEKITVGNWKVNQWLKKAVLLSFKLNDMYTISGGPGGANWWDKVDSKFEGWHEGDFREAGFRAVPHCIVRRSAYVAPGVVLMPSCVSYWRTGAANLMCEPSHCWIRRSMPLVNILVSRVATSPAANM